MIVLRCQDIEASRRFYEVRGLVWTQEQHGTGSPHYSATIDGDVIELYPAEDRDGFRAGEVALILPGARDSARDPDGRLVLLRES